MCVQQSDTTWQYGPVCDINIIVYLLSSFHGTKVIKLPGFPNEEMLLVTEGCWEMADSPIPVVRVMLLGDLAHFGKVVTSLQAIATTYIISVS